MEVETKRAEFVQKMDGWIADAKVYKLDPLYKYTDWNDDTEKELEYVIVSAVVAYSGPEVLIFPARKIDDGFFHPISMVEVYGERQTLDHEMVLNHFGYEV